MRNDVWEVVSFAGEFVVKSRWLNVEGWNIGKFVWNSTQSISFETISGYLTHILQYPTFYKAFHPFSTLSKRFVGLLALILPQIVPFRAPKPPLSPPPTKKFKIKIIPPINTRKCNSKTHSSDDIILRLFSCTFPSFSKLTLSSALCNKNQL